MNWRSLTLPLLAGALLLLSYARVLTGGAAPASLQDAEQFFFAPQDTSAPLVVAIAGWLLWRRRGSLSNLPGTPGSLPGLALVALGLATFCWAQLNAAHDLLPLSLAFHALGFATLAKGPGALRVVALPCFVLLLALPLPAPAYNEAVWQLQVASAQGAQWLLNLVGIAVEGDGIVFRHDEHFFLVIEECSGLRGIRTLLIVAVVVHDLMSLPRAAFGALLGLALPLGYGLNVLRIAIVAAGSEPSALTDPASHVTQGLAVLVGGTAVLFALGHLLSRGSRQARVTPQRFDLPWRAISCVLALQVLIGHTLPAWPATRSPNPNLIDIPAEHEGWIGEELPLDRLFFGQLPIGQVFDHRYVRLDNKGNVSAEVEFFIAADAGSMPRLRPWSRKLALPARTWGGTWVRREHNWSLLQDIEVVYARNGEERALVYLWMRNDEGTFRETLRSFLALERGPFARAQRRVVLRLSTPMGEGAAGEHSAKRTLDRFIGDFRPSLTRY